jgi:ABC-type transport system involved in Fe-S cluster assembly fused permease/ATPase subunit
MTSPSTFQRLLLYFHQGWTLIAILICALCSKIFIAIAPLSFKGILQGCETKALTMSLWAAGGYAALRWGSTLFSELRDVLFVPLEEKAVRKMAEDTFSHIQQLSYQFHLDRETGGLIRTIERGIKGVETFFRFFVFNIVPTFFEIIFVCGLFIYFYPPFFSLILFFTFATYWIFTLGVSQARMRLLQKANRMELSSYTHSLDRLLNYATVKLFHREEAEKKRYSEYLTAYQRIIRRLRFSLAALNVGQATILTIGLLAMFSKMIHSIIEGSIDKGDLIVLNIYMLQFIMPLHSLGFAHREMRQAWIDIGGMFQILKLPIETEDEKKAQPLIITGGHIIFEDVSFSYTKKNPVLSHCSFEILPQTTAAFVGISGSGKTSLLNLMVRFFDPEEGRILIDGQPLTSVTRLSLRKAIGVVSQDSVLFNDTILNNILYGNPDATFEDVEEAAEKSHLKTFIKNLPEGYHTVVGERGLKLSGGEKQRLAIARALIKKPSLFIFDEATSALDSKTEHSVQKSIFSAAKNVTTLVVAHRLSTIVWANQIFVLRQGAIAEQGTHNQLLEANGFYATLWKQQLVSEQETP